MDSRSAVNVWLKSWLPVIQHTLAKLLVMMWTEMMGLHLASRIIGIAVKRAPAQKCACLQLQLQMLNAGWTSIVQEHVKSLWSKNEFLRSGAGKFCTHRCWQILLIGLKVDNRLCPVQIRVGSSRKGVALAPPADFLSGSSLEVMIVKHLIWPDAKAWDVISMGAPGTSCGPQGASVPLEPTCEACKQELYWRIRVRSGKVESISRVIGQVFTSNYNAQ